MIVYYTILYYMFCELPTQLLRLAQSTAGDRRHRRGQKGFGFVGFWFMALGIQSFSGIRKFEIVASGHLFWFSTFGAWACGGF